MWFDRLTTNGVSKVTTTAINKLPFVLSLSKDEISMVVARME